ncbi:MAG: AsmA-like C-terminal domain-containing protein [Geobacter sp.]|nr:AsmA-like C-terminal domain-containing protein [Geobacter sp.]
MRISRKKLLIIISILAVIFVVSGAATVILTRLLHLDTYKEEILSEVQRTLNRPVFYEKGAFSLRYGPSFTFTNIVVKDRDGVSTLVKTERLTFGIALLPLLEKRLVLKKMTLDHPYVNLSRDTAGVFNISDLLEKRGEEKTPLHIKGLRIKTGYVRFVDAYATTTPVTHAAEDLDLYLSDLARDENCKVEISSLLPGEGKKGEVSLKGKARLAAKGKPFTDSRLDARIMLRNIDADRYWPYYRKYVPFQKLAGRLDTDTTFKGKLSEFKADGSFRVTGLQLTYPQVFHASLTPREVRLKYAMSLDPKEISVKTVDLFVDGLGVKGSFAISDLDTPDPRIAAKAATSTFRLESFGQYIPYGIIVKDTSEFIEQRIKGGTYKLDEGKLEGRVSQIAHMEVGTNYNVLHIRGTVENGLLTFGPNVPAFNGIKGNLEMLGKDFILSGMSANFGTSPFTLNGRITDYPLNNPCTYPFTMTMTPRQPEAAWLLMTTKTGKLGLVGNSRLALAGDGTSSNYSLNGDWELGPAAFIYTDIMSKPAGKPLHLNFKTTINEEEFRVNALTATLPPLSLAASASYRFANRGKLAMAIKTNQFPLQDIAPMLPAVKNYQPAGKMQANIKGESLPGKPSEMRWNGALSFSGASFKPTGDIKPVSNLDGAVRFTGNSLESSNLAGKLGSSMIYGKGSIVDFDNPSLNLTFTSPHLSFADLGMRTTGQATGIDKVRANISLQNRILTIKTLSAQMNRSIFNLSGTVQNSDTKKMDLNLSAPNLELDDLILLATLEPERKSSEPPIAYSVKANINAFAGKLYRLPFKKLHADLNMDNRVLYLQNLQMQALGGELAGTGRFDFGVEKGPRMQLSYNLRKISAEQLLQVFGVEKKLITGTATITGDLTAKGSELNDLKRTALGSMNINCEEGVLRRFSLLSKIFSILNFSQLLKFQLPDMVSSGMPYNEIRGTLAIHDGQVSTQDLFMDSDAINISVVGSADMLKRELNMTVGTQPLQTVDKVVSRIPIVGWVLTGREKTLVTTYFEAKGNWEDPMVTAIPVKSMTKGVFDIFKRLFQLPGKLITDTGEVILGN